MLFKLHVHNNHKYAFSVSLLHSCASVRVRACVELDQEIVTLKHIIMLYVILYKSGSSEEDSVGTSGFSDE